MDLFGIVKRSWEIVSKRRWLWGLGILAAFTEVSGADFMNNSPFDDKEFKELFTPTTSPSPAPSATAANGDTNMISRVLGDMTDRSMWESMFSTVSNWATSHVSLLLGLALAAIVLALIFLWLSYVARAGIIKSVRAVEDHNKDLGFSKGFKAGLPYAGRLFGLQIVSAVIAAVITLALLFIFGAPLAISADGSAIVKFLSGLWVVLGVVFAIVALYGVFMANRYGEQAIVVGEGRVFGSFTSGLDLVQHNIKQSIYASVTHFVVSLVYGVIIGIVLAIAFLVLGGVGYAIYAGVGLAATIGYGVVVGLALLVGLFILSGIFSSYQLTFWSLVYKHLHGKHTAKHHVAS
jgi:hypothetical protein